MGKIKTVVMGDMETEEAARKKAEEKREQKSARGQSALGKKTREKETKDETQEANSEIQKGKHEEGSETRDQRQQAEYKVPDETKVAGDEAKDRTQEANSEMQEGKREQGKEKTKTERRNGKAYVRAKSLVDSKKLYSPAEAIDLVKKTSISSFDGSVEVHLNVTDKALRGSVGFPHATGKVTRVKIASDLLIKQLIDSPKIDFDVLVASPEMMLKLSKVAKILGPKGLMPNPKTNTISDNPEELVKIRSSSVQWKTQGGFPIIHAVVGKVSFETKKLEENLAALVKSVGADKIRSAFLKATMGPSIRVEV